MKTKGGGDVSSDELEAGLFTRYYVPISPTAALYPELKGYKGGSVEDGTFGKTSGARSGYEIGLGLAMMINRHIGVDFKAFYGSEKNKIDDPFEDEDYNFTNFGFRFSFQIYF